MDEDEEENKGMKEEMEGKEEKWGKRRTRMRS